MTSLWKLWKGSGRSTGGGSFLKVGRPLPSFLPSCRKVAPLNPAIQGLWSAVSFPVAGSGAEPQLQMHFSAFSGGEMHPVTTDLASSCAVQMHLFSFWSSKKW